MTENALSRLIVFEAVNETLRELYVGVSALDLAPDEIALLHRERPPAAIAHWRADQRAWYRLVEAGLPDDQAEAFIKGYAESAVQKGWKVLRDRP